jgi:hypothetical protein
MKRGFVMPQATMAVPNALRRRRQNAIEASQ